MRQPRVRCVGVVAFLFVFLVLARDAFAVEDDVQSLLVCDAVAFAPPVIHLTALFLTIAGPQAEGGEESLPITAAVGGAIYALCAPTLHLVARRPLAAVGSFSARLGGPLAGATATYAIYRLTDGDTAATVLAGLAAVPTGFVLAMLTDYFFFTPRVAPSATPVRGGATAGLTLTF